MPPANMILKMPFESSLETLKKKFISNLRLLRPRQKNVDNSNKHMLKMALVIEDIWSKISSWFILDKLGC